MDRKEIGTLHRSRGIAAAFAAALLAALAFPPGARLTAGDMPAYELQVKVECASPEAAERAELKFLPLPPGKTVAFSCRWDDSNPRHLRMKELMRKYGYRGTFYLTSMNADFIRQVLPQLCRDGFTIGNHTVSHTYLPLLTPNGIFFEMLFARIRHETLSGQTETAFIFPYGCFENRFFPDSPQVIAGCLRRTGILGGPDRPMFLLDKLPGNEFHHSGNRMIRPGDRNTSTEKFDADVKRSLPKAGKTAHLTLGVHVWHSDADFVELEKSLKKHAGQPEWWYCNENEFLAYAHMFRHARIVGKKRDGRTLVFTLEMPCPEYLGSATSLWAECDGKALEIRHTRKVPAKIAAAAPTETVPGFADLKMKLSFSAPDRLRFEADNRGAPLKDLRLLLRLPPDFREETIFEQVGDLAGNFSREWKVTPVPAGASAGKQLTALQTDFTRDGIAGRIWVTCLREIRQAAPAAQVRCAAGELAEADMERLSRPATEPDPARFLPVRQKPGYRDSVFHLPVRIVKQNAPTVLMDFDGGRKMILKGDLPAVVYCNGVRIGQPRQEGVLLDAPAGKCRILLSYGTMKRVPRQLVLILTPAEK